MKNIGKYQIIRRIGMGGMATVFLVRDMLMDQHFAMKVLHQQYSDNESIRKRFIREARVQINLNHPNIIRCFDVNFEDGYYYILLEYVAGPSLAQVLKERQQGLPVEVAISLFIQILAGINYAHRQNVVHRDIKPHNILIANYQGQVTETSIAKIGDFGIAKALEGSSHTSTGAKLGTLYYMSPEQLVSSGKVDRRADIYSLGITLYQMLTGKLPYRATSSEFSMMEAILKENIIDPRELRQDIPNWLVDILFKATAKSPEDRYQSGEEMMAAIQDGLSAGAPSVPEEKTVPRKSDEKPVETIAPQKKAPPKPSPEKKTPAHPQVQEPPRGTGRRFAAVVITVLLVLIVVSGAVAGYFLYWKKPLLPDLKGEKWLVAEKLLKRKGFRVYQKREYHSFVPAGAVIRMRPAPGKRYEKGTTVELLVSRGEQDISVPKVSSKSLTEVLDLLESKGLRVSNVRKMKVKKGVPGLVKSIFPPPGRVLQNGSSVSLTVNRPLTEMKFQEYLKDGVQDVLEKRGWFPEELLFMEDFSEKSGYSWDWTVPAQEDSVRLTSGRLLLSKHSSQDALTLQIPVPAVRNLLVSTEMGRYRGATNAEGGLYLELESGAYVVYLVNLKKKNYFCGVYQNGKWIKKIARFIDKKILDSMDATGMQHLDMVRYLSRVVCFLNGKKLESFKENEIYGYSYPGLVVVRPGSRMYFDKIRVLSLN